MLAPVEEKYYQDFLAVLSQKWRPSKAAFYTLDPAQSVFCLKAQFGFTRTDHLAERLGRNDTVVNYVYEHREPTFLNNVNKAGKLTDLMVQATSTRMLLAPLYLDGRIMGLVDVREKAGRLGFTQDDIVEISDLLRRFAIELRRIADARGGASIILSEPAPEIERSLDRVVTVTAPPSPLERTSGFSTAQLSTSGPFRRAGALLRESDGESGNQLPNAVARTLRFVEDTLAPPRLEADCRSRHHSPSAGPRLGERGPTC